MTVAVETVIVHASSIAAGIPINFNAPVHAANEVRVLYGDDEDVAVLNTHYTVTLTPPGYASAQITPLAALVTLTSEITIIRNQPLTQELSIPTNSRLPEREIEKAFDRGILSLQQVEAVLDRAIRITLTDDPLPPMIIPSAPVRASTVIGFDEDGNLMLYAPGEGSDGAHPSLPPNTIAGNASGITAPLVGLTPTQAKEILAIEIADLQDIPAKRILGNNDVLPAPVVAMTQAQARAILELTTADIAGLDGALANKAPLIHTHAIADVINLQAQLDAISAGAALPAVQFATLAELKADVGEANNTFGMVFNDAAIVTASWSRNANVATINTATAHGFSTNQAVNVRLMTTASLNGIKAITVIDADTFTFADVGANVGNTADTGGRVDHEGIWQWHTADTQWDWIAPAPFTQLSERVSILEIETDDFRDDTAAAGDIFVYDGTGPGSGSPQSRTALTAQPLTAQDMTADAQRIILTSTPNTGVPGDFLTITEPGGVLSIESDYTNNPWLVSDGATIGRAAPYRSFVAEFTLTTVTMAGIGLGFVTQTAAPAIGGVPAELAADAEAMIMRVDGPTPIVYERDGITSAGTTITIVQEYTTGAPAVQGNVLTLTLALDDLGTGGTLTVAQGGTPIMIARVSGIAVDDYVFPVMRFGAVANQVIRLNYFEVRDASIDVPKTVYVWPGAAPGGNGSERLPYTNMREFLIDDGSDPARGIYKVYMRGGICHGGIDLRGKKVREFWLRGSAGASCIMQGNLELNAGFGHWTSLGGATPDVWEYVPPAYVSASMGIIDGSIPQVMGTGGGDGADFNHLYRGAFDITAAALQATPGSYSYQTATRRVYVNFGAGVDPNTRNIWLTYTPGIALRFTNVDDNNVGKLFIENVDFRRCFAAGVLVERGFAQIINSNIEAITGNGVQGNESGGQLIGGRIGGTYFDNFNNQGGLATIDKELQWLIEGVDFWGCPAVGAEVRGDCISNHAGHKLIVKSCNLKGASKDGLVGLSDFIVDGCIVAHCLSHGIAAAQHTQTKGSVRNTVIHNCDVGVAAVVGDGQLADIDVSNLLLYEMTRSGLQISVTGTGAANITAHSWFVRGNPGTHGWSEGAITGMSLPFQLG